jgi:very-short-patch-repair endonuclease
MTANVKRCPIHNYYAAGFGTCPECARNPVILQTSSPQAVTVVRGKKQSKLEADFAASYALLGADLPALVAEYRFHPVRKWRFDFAILAPYFVAIEIDGKVWGGRHTRGKGFIEDCTKLNAAAAMGYRVLRYTSEHLKNPFAVIAEIRQLVDYLDKLDLAA